MARDKRKTAQVVDFNTASQKRTDVLKDARREAKAKALRNRFSNARRAAETKSTSAEKVKRLFKTGKPGPRKNP